jgi:hypothetical protein
MRRTKSVVKARYFHTLHHPELMRLIFIFALQEVRW